MNYYLSTKSIYLSTTHNKEELLLVYNKQQETNYYLSKTNNKEELLPVYNKQQRRFITGVQQTIKRNHYLSTTNKKEELLPV